MNGPVNTPYKTIAYEKNYSSLIISTGTRHLETPREAGIKYGS